LDVHEFGSFSEEWMSGGFIKASDVQLGMLTNLNTSAAIAALQHEAIFPHIARRMKEKGYKFQEYIVGTPATRIRHSTTEINDGRQSFGILGTVSFIQEGRQWKTLEDQLQRRTLAQLTSIEALLEYCSGHADDIKDIVRKERERLLKGSVDRVAIRMDHFAGQKKMLIPVQTLATGVETTWQVTPYHGEVKLIKEVSIPTGYLVDSRDTTVLALLRRHHIVLGQGAFPTAAGMIDYWIDSVGSTVLEEDTIPLLSVRMQPTELPLTGGEYYVSTRQLQRALIAVILEPESNWGLTKYDEFSFLRQTKRYPIRRIP
jgi:hypothetical protein